MELFESIVGVFEHYVWSFGPSIGGEQIPLVVILLLGVGIFLTIRLGFVQFRRLGHGFGVTSGKYDDPDEPGDVSHFQALTTALSATVGIGNIAGVAIAIHFGGPGALFWMWVTALLGMATKFTEVTLAQKYRVQQATAPDEAKRLIGTVSGGPMYYIERGLGPNWKWMGVFFAFILGITAFLTGNGVQANTVADVVGSEFGIAAWVSGLVTALIVALVILGGITRIGKVTGILAPAMAGVYVFGALIILILNAGQVLPTIGLIFQEAFNPSAGVAGTGTGAFLITMMWGVRRGLFSNEAGQGSAPIAHSAAKTDEPVSEGVVALLEPFIDTILICSMTALVILVTGSNTATFPTPLTLGGGDISYVAERDAGAIDTGEPPQQIVVRNGVPQVGPDAARLAWHEVPVERFYTGMTDNEELAEPFSGTIFPQEGRAVANDGTEYTTLYGPAVESGAPLTQRAFERGLAPLGGWGGYIVLLSVLLFAISTAISWSYYGDRCANYLFGEKAILPYKIVFVLMHFVGAVLALSVIWTLGDVFLGIVIIPNLIALVLLSGTVRKEMKSYFERMPWVENAEVQRRIAEERRREKGKE
ncbi:MAG: amino acid carrier protein [Bacteroidetes bacterium]|jgi:AGCS family alanine or glycine:cation symporter|nr:amino acid carrier protein [Bacteroidota bacterium]